MKQIELNIKGVSLKPCPFCGSDNLLQNQVMIVNDTEVLAVECNQCFASSQQAHWNIRAFTRSQQKPLSLNRFQGIAAT